MSGDQATERKPGTVALASVIGRIIEPVCAKRGFATADLLSAWSDVVGPRYAACTLPEKLIWPRRDHTAGPSGATLVIRVDAAMALYLQHETTLILDRINGFLGFGAVAQLRIVQGPVAPPPPAAPRTATLTPSAEAAVEAAVSDVDGPLREALARLGRGVYASLKGM